MRWMWIDRVVELVPRQRLVAVKHVCAGEEYLAAHFPGGPGRPATPIMPASLIIEGMAQSAGILVGHAEGFREKVVLAKVSLAELDLDAVPGDTIRFTAEIDRLSPQGASTRGTVERVDPREPGRSVPMGRVDLVFSHLDQNMAGTSFPEGNFVFGASFRTLLETSGIAC
jgi:3-hydroxyacyl-[acyl-carrier-protein] dehydratase